MNKYWLKRYPDNVPDHMDTLSTLVILEQNAATVAEVIDRTPVKNAQPERRRRKRSAYCTLLTSDPHILSFEMIYQKRMSEKFLGVSHGRRPHRALARTC